MSTRALTLYSGSTSSSTEGKPSVPVEPYYYDDHVGNADNHHTNAVCADDHADADHDDDHVEVDTIVMIIA